MPDNNGQTATHADLQHLDRLGQTIGQQMAQVEERLTKRMQDFETKLLSAFFTYQEHRRIEFAALRAEMENASRSIELRLDNLETRVIELERRVLRGGEPPQPKQP